MGEALEQLREELFIKRKTLLQTQTGFYPDRLSRAKTDAALDYQQEKAQHTPPASAQLSPDSVAHPELFKRLAAWRTEKGEEQELPMFRILPNKSLLDIAQNVPGNPARLRQAHGIGKKNGAVRRGAVSDRNCLL